MRVALLAVASLLAFAACPPTGVVCRAGTVPCNAGCVDPANDARNCGACGTSCAASQECRAGACVCQPGTTSCNGTCAVLDYDSLNCGACGVACDGGVCEGGACKASCTLGVSVRCGAACVNPATDPANCGGCGQACLQGQSCRAGSCGYEAVAACFTTGQVVGLSASTLSRGTLTDLGNGPAALAVVPGGVLAVDGTDNLLYQAAVDATGIRQSWRANAVGGAATQAVVDGQRVYVVNAATHTLQVLQPGASGTDVREVLSRDAGAAPVLPLVTVGELDLGANTFPEGVAVQGGALWVPLYGGYGAAAAAAGQAVARVVVSDAGVPTRAGTVSLAGLDLRRFDGGAPVPRPWAVLARRGAVYVVLNNLNPDTYLPEGPGLLARVEADGGASVVGLGPACLNPQWAAEVGSRLAVSCGGRAAYDSNYALVGVSSAGVVLLDAQDQVQDLWNPACAGGLDAGCHVSLFLPGRFAVRGSRLLVGDQNAGAMAVLDVSDAGLTLVTSTLQVCPVGSFGVGNVSDVVSLP